MHIDPSPSVLLPLWGAKIAPLDANLRLLEPINETAIILGVLLIVIVVLSTVVIVLGFNAGNGK